MRVIPGGENCNIRGLWKNPSVEDNPDEICPFYSTYELDEDCSFFAYLYGGALVPENVEEGKRCTKCLAAFPDGGTITVEPKHKLDMWGGYLTLRLDKEDT
jgi:hypothetical protein